MSEAQAAVELQRAIQEKQLPPLLIRDFKLLTEQKDDCVVSGAKVRIMQWNMLAQGLSADNFVLCPPDALDLENRKLRIVEEITRTAPCVLCMEECDQFEYLQNTLAKFGYDGIFYPKPDSPCLKMEKNWGTDGVAIFYRKEKFTLVENYKIVLKDSEGKPMKHVALACKFQIQGLDKERGTFIVAVIHQKAKPGFEETRHFQTISLLKNMTEIAEDYPLVIAGDFNGTKEEAYYHEMSHHDLNLLSAYTLLSPVGDEPPYTTWKVREGSKGHSEVCRTIDFIWFRRDKAVVTSLLTIPKESEIGKGRLPCMKYPSDHFAIACDLQFIQ